MAGWAFANFKVTTWARFCVSSRAPGQDQHGGQRSGHRHCDDAIGGRNGAAGGLDHRKAKGLFLDKIENVYYIKTGDRAHRRADGERQLPVQLCSREGRGCSHCSPNVEQGSDAGGRTNEHSVLSRNSREPRQHSKKLLAQIDKPTKQVMIEARLVEITANPKQAYGINWSGVVGGPTNPQSITPMGGAPALSSRRRAGQNPPTTGFALGNNLSNSLFSNLHQLVGQFAILSVPQMNATLQMLNDDADAEFLPIRAL